MRSAIEKPICNSIALMVLASHQKLLKLPSTVLLIYQTTLNFLSSLTLVITFSYKFLRLSNFIRPGAHFLCFTLKSELFVWTALNASTFSLAPRNMVLLCSPWNASSALSFHCSTVKDTASNSVSWPWQRPAIVICYTCMLLTLHKKNKVARAITAHV
ncbi:hypothetical protein CAPTEDRAFT_187684 [Capitella teleta]|uniref:Uncharacterized protein n=1 Tax=Capitella teleta TaxID=283909 RepID=R7VEL2_CAPTE|nr:hypothetical protein CAPTEDRAFT_187684 [Capitella teleta]|eukprot:ELU17027.1 hypothetical protein CAPTEDRAFT_187684 [Capitella teleta]